MHGTRWQLWRYRLAMHRLHRTSRHGDRTLAALVEALTYGRRTP